MTVSHRIQNKRQFLFTALLLAALLLLSACQPESIPLTGDTPTPEPVLESTPTPVPAVDPTPTLQPDPTPEIEAVEEAVLEVADTEDFGEILVGNDGMTLYIFTIDGPNQSNCDEDCLALWPPLLTEGSPTLGEGVDPDLVSSAEMEDGSRIVTYNQRPLYFWAHDRQPGDTTGQGVGEVWFVVSPEGEPLGMDEPAASVEPADEAVAEDAQVDLDVAADTRFGDILVDREGMTLYLFLMDEPGVSNCRGGCLSLWPPLVVEDEPVLGEELDPDLIGSASLDDGRQVLTYNGWPLYYYSADLAPGDTTGQAVGSVWFVVSPEGDPVRQERESQPASSGGPSDDYDPYGEPDY